MNSRSKQYDVVALGELLIDFTDSGKSDQGNLMFEANPGGAPCNVLAMLQKLGHHTSFIGKVGDDIFGKKLKRTIEELGIDTSNLVISDEANTTLAFVETAPDGDRDFSFYRNPGADMMLSRQDIRADLIADSRIFHFGTLSMTHERVRESTKYALSVAKENKVLISFDPNLRKPLWNSLDDAAEQVAFGLRYCDILKISDNEIRWFTGKQDFDAGVQVLNEMYHIPLILLSMGRDGSRAYYDGRCVDVSAFLQEQTIETTGAGDTFGGCCLHYILNHGINGLTDMQLTDMLMFANAAASIITTRKGALRVMPDACEIEDLLRRN